MKLDEIQELWDKHSKIDEANLANESLRIPDLHNKFYKIYYNLRLHKDIQKQECDKIYKLKWEYYLGKLSPEKCNDLGWEIPAFTVNKTDVDKYLAADDELNLIRQKLSLTDIKLEFLEQILKIINARAYHIKSAIDFLRFSNGS